MAGRVGAMAAKGTSQTAYQGLSTGERKNKARNTFAIGAASNFPSRRTQRANRSAAINPKRASQRKRAAFDPKQVVRREKPNELNSKWPAMARTPAHSALEPEAKIGP